MEKKLQPKPMSNNHPMSAEQFYQKRRAETLSSSHFETEFFSDKFKELLRKSMMLNSFFKFAHMMNMHFLTYENIITFKRNFFMAEVPMLLDILKASTPNEMGHTLEEHLDMHHKVIIPIEEKWAEIEMELMVGVKREVETKMKASNGVPAHKKIIIA